MTHLIQSFIDQIEQVHSGNGWIGVNFKKKISELNETQFFFKTKGTHSIAEIVSHLNTWRQEAVLKIITGKGSITDKDPSNWLPNQQLLVLGMNKILHEYDKSLSLLLKELREKDDSFLRDIYYDTDFKDNYPYIFLIQGMLQHDLYHLGQIALLLKIAHKSD